MPLRTSWREAELIEVLKPALDSGETRVNFATLDEARKFRFALYGFRDRTDIGKNLSFILETITTEEDDVTYSVLIQETPVYKITRATKATP